MEVITVIDVRHPCSNIESSLHHRHSEDNDSLDRLSVIGYRFILLFGCFKYSWSIIYYQLRAMSQLSEKQ